MPPKQAMNANLSDGVPEPGIPIIDSHVHVWSDGTPPYPYADLVPCPNSPVTAEHLLDVMQRSGTMQAVLVQPSVHGYDNSYIADCLRRFPGRFAAVGRVEPSRGDAADHLRRLVQEDGFVGLRLNLRQECDLVGWQSRSLWTMAADLGIPISLLLDPPFLPEVPTLARRFPDVSIVIDHLARIRPALPGATQAQKDLLALARIPNVLLKVSAFQFLSQEPYPWENLHRMLTSVTDAFGPRRLMWGSDFPGDADTYDQALRLARNFTAWSGEAGSWLLNLTARSTFKLAPAPATKP